MIDQTIEAIVKMRIAIVKEGSVVLEKMAYEIEMNLCKIYDNLTPSQSTKVNTNSISEESKRVPDNICLTPNCDRQASSDSIFCFKHK